MDLTRLSARHCPAWLASTLLALVALLPNLNGLRSFFIGDDFELLVQFGRFRGLGMLGRFTFFHEWEPFWYLDFYRDYKLWELDPAGYHLASVLWLAVGVISVYGLLRSLWPDAGLAPWAAALLFATHPLHDEAVMYVAARGHVMATSLMVLALWLYVKARSRPVGTLAWVAWITAALCGGLLAIFSKETALVLPAAVAVLEWAVLSRGAPRARALLSAAAAAVLFLLPALVYLAAMQQVVGLDDTDSRFRDLEPREMLDRAGQDLPAYVLIGGLPLPFGVVDAATLAPFYPIGWVLLAALVTTTGIIVARRLVRGSPISVPAGLWVLGFTLFAIQLVPVFVADLGLHRRYVFGASLGLAIMAAAALEELASRRRALATALVLVLSACGAAVLAQRNELYDRSGAVARNLMEVAHGGPLERLSNSKRGPKRYAVVTLPRYWGGDFLSGVYLLHWTDVRSALWLANLKASRLDANLECEYADDYSAVARPRAGGEWDLTVSFRTSSAFEAARAEKPREPRDRDTFRIVLVAEDEASKTLHYRLSLTEVFAEPPGTELYLYSDGAFRLLAASS